MGDLIRINPPRATDISVSPCLTKSQIKAMACELHFAYYHLTNNPILRQTSSELARTGLDFHAWRREYVTHLVDVERIHDRDWARDWLKHFECTADARQLIEHDIYDFEVDYRTVMGVELFLSVDEHYQPLDRIEITTPGQYLEYDRLRARVSGTIDLLLVDGDRARIVDPKSGWSTATVSDHEPPHYAALVLSHFPQVQRVDFVWEFIRARATRPAVYTRADLPWIYQQIDRAQQRKREIVDKMVDGKPLAVNSMSGLCGFCSLACPLQTAVEQGLVTVGPLQTEDDIRDLARKLLVVSKFASEARKALRLALDQVRSVEIADGWRAELEMTAAESYPLIPALQVLGLQLTKQRRVDHGGHEIPGAALNDGCTEMVETVPVTGGNSPIWDIPLDKLAMKSTKLKSAAKAKKRLGMADQLAAIAETKPRSTLKIRHADSLELDAFDGDE